MKIITKEEERAHYNATLGGGTIGGILGLAGGFGAVALAHRRFPAFQSLTLPLKAFLVTSAGTFGAIINADRASRRFEKDRNEANKYRDTASLNMEAARASEDRLTRLKTWGRENRYGIITASWVASMAIALGLVGRNPYLSRSQKLVQARVYAQALTVSVLVATAALEIGDANRGQGRWETVRIIDPNDPEHKHVIEKQIHHERYAGEDLWRDMVENEERKMERQRLRKERRKEAKRREERQKITGGGEGGVDSEEEDHLHQNEEEEGHHDDHDRQQQPQQQQPKSVEKTADGK